MKTICIFYKSVVLLLFAGLLMNPVVAQKTRTEQMTKVYDISPSGTLILSANRADIEILTWDRNEVKIVGELTYEGDGEEDEINTIFNAFKNMSAISSKDTLTSNLHIIASAYSRKKSFLGATEIITVLCNGDETSTLVYNYINYSYKIWIPATIAINAKCHWGKLKMASVKGNVNLTLQNNDLIMGNFGESGIFDIKFSSATIGNGGISKFHVMNSNVNVAETKNMTINARFSTFKTVKAYNVSINSNNSNFDFETLNDIDVSARFSTIRIKNNVSKSKFDLNNSSLFGNNFQTMEISARFSKLNVADIGDMRINTSDNSNFDFATVDILSCQQSRFSTFKLHEIAIEASFRDANNTNVKINKTGAAFKGFSGNFRFGTIDLIIHPNVQYNLRYNGTFGQFDVSPDRFKTGFVSDKNGSVTTIQGTNANAKCNIELVTNNTTCRIR